MILPEELASIDFLRNLGEPYLNRIAGLARLEECQEGAVLFREGHPSSRIWFVLSGEIHLEVEEPDEGPVQVATIGPGELLGWSPILGSHSMTGTGRAATRCRLAVMDVGKILALCDDDPRFGMAFLRQVALTVSRRLRDARRQVVLARTLSQRSPFTLPPDRGS